MQSFLSSKVLQGAAILLVSTLSRLSIAQQSQLNPALESIRDLQDLEASIDANHFTREEFDGYKQHFLDWIDAPERCAAEMISLLGDDDAAVRTYAAAWLGCDESEMAVSALLISLAEDEDPAVRACSAVGLGRIGNRRATGSLLAALDDQHVGVRHQVQLALGYLGDPSAVPRLIEMITVEDDVRSCGVGTPFPLVAMWLPTRYENPEAVYSCHAARALVAIGTPAVDDIAAALGESDAKNRYRLARALGYIGGVGTDRLKTLLGSDNAELRALAATGLGASLDPTALLALEAARSDEDAEAQEAATAACAEIREAIGEHTSDR